MNAKNRHGDFVTDVYAFAYFASEYQHNLFLDGLLKRLYQEAGVCLCVVIVAEYIQMHPSYDVAALKLIPSVHFLVIEICINDTTSAPILPVLARKCPYLLVKSEK
ncbi:hypothetical protein [Pseudomonas sp. NPDC089734]|uniref:hypothetical protein n=1 Tax=Pseudomonas sp. NPDC089734 TaxID=3364469 RepID=UPI00382F4DEE